MKKINSVITAAAIALALPAIARADLSFTVNGTAVASGDSVATASPVITPVGPMNMVKYKPEVLLSSSFTASNIVVRVKSLSGQQFQCCAGGQCEQSTSITKKNIYVQEGEPLDIQFEYSAMQAADAPVPTVSAKIEAQYYLEDESLQSFVITMSETAGISLVPVKPASVTPTADGLVYDLPSDGTITLHSLTGSIISRTRVTGTGILPLDIPSGVYVYRLEAGKASATGKFIRR